MPTGKKSVESTWGGAALADGSPWSSFLRCWLVLDGGGSLIVARFLAIGLFGDRLKDDPAWGVLEVFAFFGAQSFQEVPCGVLLRSDEAEFSGRFADEDEEEE